MPVHTALQRFARGDADYVVAHPGELLRVSPRRVFDALYARLGPVLAEALDPERVVDSPVGDERDGRWLQRSHSVGINLRTTGGLLGAVHFALTLPPWQNAVHLLPVFEPGVVGSLYGMASWRVNAEFYDARWTRIAPRLHDVNTQLRAFVNVCHALGKTVGLDVIPHVDRFSEIALANPWLFEWVRRDDERLLDHSADLHLGVEEAIVQYQRGRLDRDGARAFFARAESEITAELFGSGDARARNQRRDRLIQHLYARGYETLPATMAPPYRGLELDADPAAVTVDERGRRWREYKFTRPQAMSRVFGPLTRYKLYERLDDNRDWAIDFARPREAAWEYVARHYREAVDHFGFDYLRGDMSHVQMRPGGVPAGDPGRYYDIHAYVKAACAKTRPHVAYFAESFLTADDFMTYGSEAAHLDASDADVALGNLQNYAPDEPAFHALLAEYDRLRSAHGFAPAFTLFTADKDDPRFDRNFGGGGSVARYFFAAFCPRFPSYSSLGFRVRDEHPEPAPNESYSKLYVFHYDEGPKATRGPYRWGANDALLAACHSIDAERARRRGGPHGSDDPFSWIDPPDPTSQRKIIAWATGGAEYYVNFGAGSAPLRSPATAAWSTAAPGRKASLGPFEAIIVDRPTRGPRYSPRTPKPQ